MATILQFPQGNKKESKSSSPDDWAAQDWAFYDEPMVREIAKCTYFAKILETIKDEKCGICFLTN